VAFADGARRAHYMKGMRQQPLTPASAIIRLTRMVQSLVRGGRPYG
jgi:hypothetical protein